MRRARPALTLTNRTATPAAESEGDEALIRYLIRRCIWAVALFIVVTMISFVLFFLIPADPAKFACGRACTEVQVQKVAHYLGTDRPLYVQYLRFLGRLMPISFTGGPHLKSPNLGHSFVNRQPVTSIVGAGRAGDRLARPRRHGHLDADRACRSGSSAPCGRARCSTEYR